MSLSPCSVAIHSIPHILHNSIPGVFIGNQRNCQLHRIIKFDYLKTKATGDKETKPKTKSGICTHCDGNGAVQCSQCKGVGVNPEDSLTDNLKPGTHVGFAEEKKKCYVEIAMELAL